MAAEITISGPNEVEQNGGDMNDELSEINFPAEVEDILQALNIKVEPLDQSDFSVVDYINEMFPTEQSLANIEDVMGNIQHRIHELDEETRQVIRGQWVTEERGQEVVADATHMIQTLFAKIREVQERATRSEEMVRDITRDIQQLDQAKKNLTVSITTLNNVTLLITAVEKLKDILGLETDETTGAVALRQSSAGQSQTSGERLPYHMIADSLSQAQHVLGQLMGRYHDMTLMRQLATEVKAAQVELTNRVNKDFRDLLSGPGARNLQANIPAIQALCQVMDLLDDRVVNDMLAWFIQVQLSEYLVLFAESESTAWLDKIDHRYSWLRSCLQQVEKKFSRILPAHWLLMERLVVEFCRITKDALTQIMARRRPELTHNLLVFALQRTHTFEANLDKSFTGDTLRPKSAAGSRTPTTPATTTLALASSEGDMSNPFYEALAAEGGELETKPRTSTSPFLGIISRCFEEHMSLYVENVEKLFSDQLHNRLIGDFTINQSSMSTYAADRDFGDVFKATSGGPTNQESDPTENTLYSATDLFLMYKKVLKQAIQLSRRDTLVQLGGVLKKYLREYANRCLTGQLPIKRGGTGAGLAIGSGGAASAASAANQIIQSILREEQMVKLSKEDLHRVCVILVTASYCLRTAEDLEKKLREEIDSDLSEQISFAQEVDVFGQCRSSCVQLLASDLEAACDPALYAMSKLPWSTIDSVGDQSNYVTAIVNHFRGNAPVIRDTLLNVRAYFTQFCIKFANTFIPKFISTLFKCRPISTVGAEQLLLDTHSLKTALVDMPIVNTKFSPQPPRSYTNLVLQGMGKAEMIIKAVMTPADKPVAFVDSFRQLLPDSDLAEFQKILEMKGLRRQEQNVLCEMFRERRTQGSDATGGHSTNQDRPGQGHGIQGPSRVAVTSEGAQGEQESSRIRRLEKLIKMRL